jgi:hypothetical protein
MGVLMGLSIINFSARAETVWSGPATNFNQATASADVLLPGVVSLRRQPNSFLYNTNVESSATTGTPSNTEWAFGTMANHNSLNYKPFSQIHSDAASVGQHLSTYLLSGPMVLHIINQDIFVAVTFTSWAKGGSTFTYLRSRPALAPPTPTVTITNPVNNAVFAEPADVKITANATVSSGTVTNVTFFRDTTTIGSKLTPPFTTTASALPAGNYALKAVAIAAGISATSSVVNISVVTPATTSLSAQPASVADGQFSFSFSATPGLLYEVDVSSNLFDWTPMVTNVASSNLIFITNDISGDGNYYRVGRLPNP